MEILVIRHGQSEADILHRLEGRADFPLTDLGKEQARQMAEWVSRNHRPDILLSSPLRRAATTAQILGDQAHVPVEYWELLKEFNNGLIAGLTHEQADQQFPKPAVIHPHESYYEQETKIQFRARAEEALSRILYEYPSDSRVAIVTHGGMITQLFRSFLRLPLESDVHIHTTDTGVHLWVAQESSRQIAFLNSTVHLTNA